MTITPEHADDIEQLKRAFVTIKKLRASLDSLKQARNEPIAIIGIGCRFPGGANSPELFWDVLRNGVDTVSEIPTERWNADHFYDPNPDIPGKMQSKYGAFIQDIDKFDANFFGITPREANAMDPQQRIVLEVAWEALEDAGIIPGKLAQSQTGVFIGMGLNDYGRIQVPAQVLDPELIDTYSISGNALCITANRLSYFLNLQGASMVIDSACSSSLVAVHQACQGLRRGELDLALAGGVNLLLAPETALTVNKFLAPDGRCKTFDARADGYVRGEGAGIVILKRLSDALADHNLIYAVIRGSAVNQDGYSSGLTVPNGVAQQKLIRQAIADAGVQPDHIQYVEAHGTGTSLGDPIEVHALNAVLSHNRSQDNPCAIGSVKTNIGHLEAAAGVAGLIKVALALKYNQIPPSIHFETPNPNIPFEDMSIRVQRTSSPWPKSDRPPLAGVSSFGFGGTNAHTILEAAPHQAPEPSSIPRPLHLLSLSAKTENALDRQAEQFLKHVADFPDELLADLCYSANTGRSHFPYRLALLAGSTAGLGEQLRAYLDKQQSPNIFIGQAGRNTKHKIAFLYTGQGSQYAAMGRSLYDTQPTFRKALDRCAEILNTYLEKPLLQVLYPDGKEQPGILDELKPDNSSSNSMRDPSKLSLIDQTAYAQPSLFALEYALTELWRSWGIEPDAVVGHSVGEYVAACVAGVFSLEDGLKLIAERGRLMQALNQNGAMAAIFATEERVAKAVAPYAASVSIATINGNENIVVSGMTTTVQALVESMQAEGIKTQYLSVSHAFHSPLMEPMLTAFGQVASQIQYHKPKLPLISDLNGKFFPPDEIPGASYWIRHVRETVRFSKALETLNEKKYTHYLEIGPKPTLTALGKRSLSAKGQTWMTSLREGKDDWHQILQSLATLYTQGSNVDWEGVDRDYAHAYQQIKVPTYPFERKRYWFSFESSSRQVTQSIQPAQILHPLLGRQIYSPVINGVSFETQIRIDSLSFLEDHQVFGQIVFPATAYLEMILAAAMQAFGNQHSIIEDVVIRKALILDNTSKTGKTVQLILSPDKTDLKQADFQIFSEKNRNEWNVKSSWQLHVSGKVRADTEDKSDSSIAVETLESIRTRCQDELQPLSFYQNLRVAGIEYGSDFQNIKQLWRNSQHTEALGRIQLPDHLTTETEKYQIHPVLLDACIQVIGALIDANHGKTDLYLPIGIDHLEVHQKNMGREVWSHASINSTIDETSEVISGDIQLFNMGGDIVAEITGIHFQRAHPESLLSVSKDQDENRPATYQDWLYEIIWQVQENKNIRRSEKPGHWLFFVNKDDDSTHRLINLLEGQGETCQRVYPGPSYKKLESGAWQLAPNNSEEFKRLLDEYREYAGRSPLQVVYCWSLNYSSQEITISSIREDQILGYGSVLCLAQALASSSQTDSPRLWLVTRRAQAVISDEKPLGMTQSPIWGFARTFMLEHPQIHCVCMDLDADVDNCQSILDELLSSSQEDQIAFRANQRYVPRLAHSTLDVFSNPKEGSSLPTPPLQLNVTKRGMLDNLVLEPMERSEPASHEVEIELHATGLNFRDVLNVLGMYPGQTVPLGNECAGTVVAIGRDVTRFTIGDEVLAIAGNTFRSYVNVASAQVFHKPKNLTFSEAVSIPTTFLTAYYGLCHLAGIKKDDRVLIHAAAGGVGLAALQLAQLAGAKLFCTAGNPEKVAFLRSMGVEHVMNSRSLDFAQEIMTLTNGQGVNIILNSLSDQFIPAGLSVLADNGYFLEIGKRDDWDEERVKKINPSLSYRRYDLASILQNDPAIFLQMLQQLLDQAEAGIIHPLPIKEFPFQDTQSAFRYMAQAKQIGKIVITYKDQHQDSQGGNFQADATYLITGGLGGLGLQVVEWMANRSAKHLVLMGRNEPSEEASKVVRKLESKGVQIITAQADVSVEEDVARVLTEIDQSMPPLRGIIHAAGVVDDGMILKQSWTSFAQVMSAKVEGSWLLHKLTQDKALDFFILYSAGATVIGSLGQGNYAAANGFMDALAYARRASGLPALSINWGPWGRVGMAANLKQSHERWNKQGIGLIDPHDGVEILGYLLRQKMTQAVVLPIQWTVFSRQFKETRTPSLLSDLVQETKKIKHESTISNRSDLRQRLAQAPASQSHSMIQAYIRECIFKVLEIDSSLPLDLQQPLAELGLDSLMAVELRNALSEGIEIALPTTLLFDYPTINSLTDYLSNLIAPSDPNNARKKEAQNDSQRGNDKRMKAIADLADLSEEEAASLLLQELKTNRKEM